MNDARQERRERHLRRRERLHADPGYQARKRLAGHVLEMRMMEGLDWATIGERIRRDYMHLAIGYTADNWTAYNTETFAIVHHVDV